MKSLLAIGMLLGAVGIEALLLGEPNAPISIKPYVPVALSRAASKPSFDSDIKPIFQARCQPCHFPGGKVYDKLPFDRPETITKLGAKLFTRIKDEKEQRVIREFLEAKN